MNECRNSKRFCSAVILEPLFRHSTLYTFLVAAAARRAPGCLPTGSRGGCRVNQPRTQLPWLRRVKQAVPAIPSILASVTGSSFCWGVWMNRARSGFSHQSEYLGFPRPGGSECRALSRVWALGLPFSGTLWPPREEGHPLHWPLSLPLLPCKSLSALGGWQEEVPEGPDNKPDHTSDRVCCQDENWQSTELLTLACPVLFF